MEALVAALSYSTRGAVSKGLSQDTASNDYTTSSSSSIEAATRTSGMNSDTNQAVTADSCCYYQ